MNRCTVFDKLEDGYGIKPENLTEREKAIIGLCTNDFLEHEEQALCLQPVISSLTLEDITKIVNAFTDINIPIEAVKEEIELNYL